MSLTESSSSKPTREFGHSDAAEDLQIHSDQSPTLTFGDSHEIAILTKSDNKITEVSTSEETEEKKLRLSSITDHQPSLNMKKKTRTCCTGPFLRHGELNAPQAPLVPIVRSALNLDVRFFPLGIEPGHISEVKGATNSGKSFLLTYFLAKFLINYPSKKAVLIDTSKKFKLRNLVAILSHFQKDLKFEDDKKSLTLSQILKQNPKFADYLDRLSIIKCYSVEEFILTLGTTRTGTDSLIKDILMNDDTVSLICIDTVDNYSYTKSLSKINVYNTMEMLLKALESTKTPVICTTLFYSEIYEKQLRKMKGRAKAEAKRIIEEDNYTQVLQKDKAWYSNVIMDRRYFTHFLTVVPATQVQKEEISGPGKSRSIDFKNAHYAKAYLRSKQRANMAGSVNHLVKFSIFSDMLWVIDDDDQNVMKLN